VTGTRCAKLFSASPAAVQPGCIPALVQLFKLLISEIADHLVPYAQCSPQSLNRMASSRGQGLRRTYVLSYDLWEERFAVTLPGDLKRSAAYLTSSAAEDWCLEQLTVPVSALGQLGRELPFWVRLGYRVQDPDASGDSGTDYSIRGLIDALSRRRKSAPQSLSIEAGPFRLPQ
jgi:hypothetical protein